MIINCKDKAMRIKYEIKNEITTFDIHPTLAIIQVGSVEESNRYVKNKIKDCDFVGVNTMFFKLAEDVSTEEVMDIIKELNLNDEVNGIIVQLPLTKHLDKEKILATIDPLKDVDGLGQDSQFVPCTPKGVMEILADENLEGKSVVIIGRSKLVGKPLVDLFLNKNATVTICHSKTEQDLLYQLTRMADIIVVAVGKENIIPTGSWVKKNCIIVDVGINFNKDTKKMVGDVNTVAVSEKANVTPVPGGVGLMTRAMLLSNVLEAFKIQNNY